MLMLADTQTTQPDPFALALVLALAVIFAVFYLRKRLTAKKATATEATPVVTEEVEAPVAPGSAGQVKTYNVPPKTCAMLMAIVADKLGKPINELRFISIKEVE